MFFYITFVIIFLGILSSVFILKNEKSHIVCDLLLKADEFEIEEIKM